MGKNGKCSCGGGGCCDGDEGCGCGCCCCGGECDCCDGSFKRRYQTKAEQIAELEHYLGELKTEVQAVEERLADLKRKK